MSVGVSAKESCPVRVAHGADRDAGQRLSIGWDPAVGGHVVPRECAAWFWEALSDRCPSGTIDQGHVCLHGADWHGKLRARARTHTHTHMQCTCLSCRARLFDDFAGGDGSDRPAQKKILFLLFKIFCFVFVVATERPRSTSRSTSRSRVKGQGSRPRASVAARMARGRPCISGSPWSEYLNACRAYMFFSLARPVMSSRRIRRTPFARHQRAVLRSSALPMPRPLYLGDTKRLTRCSVRSSTCPSATATGGDRLLRRAELRAKIRRCRLSTDAWVSVTAGPRVVEREVADMCAVLCCAVLCCAVLCCARAGAAVQRRSGSCLLSSRGDRS